MYDSYYDDTVTRVNGFTVRARARLCSVNEFKVDVAFESYPRALWKRRSTRSFGRESCQALDVCRGRTPSINETRDNTTMYDASYTTQYKVLAGPPLKIRNFKFLPPCPRREMSYTYANISGAEHDLGYRSTVTLEAGMKNFAEWRSAFYKGGT